MSRSNDGCDEDFMSAEAPSKLSIIFSGGHEQSSSDLKYTPPRQPQSRMNDGPEIPHKASDTTNRVLFATPVELYAYKEKAHKSQGRVMCCIIKDQQDRNFTMLLYRSKHHPLAQTKIHSGFTVMLQPNNYASFSDDNCSKWAVHIQGEKFKEFLSQVGICRAVAAYHEAPSISPNVVQNLSLGEGASIQEGDTIKLVYCSWNVQGGRKGSMVENEKDFKLKLTKIAELWQMGLIGAQVNMHRIIFVPNKMPNVIPLVAHEVIVEKIRKKTVSKSLSQLDFKDKPSLSSKPSDSSEPNTPSAFNKEALKNRMAKVGQPLLPPKNFQNNLAIDSECENEELKECSPSRSICSSVEEIGGNPPYTSTRCDKNFTGLVTSSHMEFQAPSQSPFSTVPYNAPASHGPIVAYSVPYPSLHPTTNNPSDPVMTLLLSESRSQNTELRIALSKVSDKVEEIHSKVKTIEEKPPVSPRLMEPLATHKPNPQELLRDITAIVNENESLKVDLRRKEAKCEELTARTSEIIEKNQKLLEEKTELLGRLNDFNDNTKEELKDFLKIKEDTDKLLDEIDKLKKDNKALQADLKVKEASIQSKDQDAQIVKRLQDENESSHQVNKTLEAKILQLKSVHQALTAEKNRMEKENKEDLERTKEKLGIEIKKLRAEIRSEKEFSEGRLDDMKKCFENDIAMLKGKHDIELQEERLRGEANLEKSTLSISESIELREKLNKLNRETDNLTNELHEIKLVKTELEKQLFEAKGTLEINTKKLNSKINLLSDEKLCIITELEAMKNKHAKLEKEYEELNKGNSSNALPTESTTQFVKQVMNAVYREAKKTFDATKTYNGKDVVQILLTVIRDTTLVHLDQSKPLESGKSSEKRDSWDTPRGTPTARSGANTPQTPRHVSSNPFLSDNRGSTSCFDDIAKEEEPTQHENEAPREGWQEAAAPPPPPPLFSDSEDDNWLS